MWLKISQRKLLRTQEAERPGINELKTGIMFEKTRANTTFMIRSVTMICLEEIVQHFSHNSKNWKKSRFLLLTKTNCYTSRSKNVSTPVEKSPQKLYVLTKS